MITMNILPRHKKILVTVSLALVACTVENRGTTEDPGSSPTTTGTTDEPGKSTTASGGTIYASSGDQGSLPSTTEPDGDSTTSDTNGETVLDFEQDVWPILNSECILCHNGPFRGDFRDPASTYAVLTDPQRAVGYICNSDDESPVLPVLVPGDPEGSGLWWLVGIGYHGCDSVYGMPKFDPRGILADFNPAAAETIRTWIAQGAAS